LKVFLKGEFQEVNRVREWSEITLEIENPLFAGRRLMTG